MNGYSRRSALSLLSGAGGALALAGCGDAQFGAKPALSRGDALHSRPRA